MNEEVYRLNHNLYGEEGGTLYTLDKGSIIRKGRLIGKNFFGRDLYEIMCSKTGKIMKCPINFIDPPRKAHPLTNIFKDG